MSNEMTDRVVCSGFYEREVIVAMGTSYEEPNFEVVIFNESDVKTSISDAGGSGEVGGGGLIYDD